ncbi:MAG TPA: tetratricopeptide repeat protein [Anaeromyxobacteraceae bacterium]|nr:tetratricopeptide repeat protein [Anaeromyxobacteraceae bacterium]
MSGPSPATARVAPARAAATARAHLKTGTALLEAGFASQAERELRAAVELDPGCAGAWVNLGGILFSRWEFAAAVEANRKAAAADPKLAIAPFNEALGHLQLGAPGDAAECLGKAIDLEPRHGAAYHHLGVALYALGRAAEARLCAAYARELGYRPSHVSAQALERAAAAAGAAGPSLEPEVRGAAPSTSSQGEGHGSAQSQ